MQKIINGKRYNTETAKEVAYTQKGEGFTFQHEALFLTKTGNWFLYYDGGAFTKYSVILPDGNQGGSAGIKVYTPDQAYEWLERNDEPEAIEQYFANRVQEG